MCISFGQLDIRHYKFLKLLNNKKTKNLKKLKTDKINNLTCVFSQAALSRMGRPNWLKNLMGRRSRRHQISNSNEASTENSKIEMTIPSGKG